MKVHFERSAACVDYTWQHRTQRVWRFVDGHTPTNDEPIGYWPLPSGSRPEDVQRAITGLGLSVIIFDDGDLGLVFANGGRDQRWEMAMGYMALGYLPPARMGVPTIQTTDHTMEEYDAVLDAFERSAQALADAAFELKESYRRRRYLS